jgi:hypothetical protein
VLTRALGSNAHCAVDARRLGVDAVALVLVIAWSVPAGAATKSRPVKEWTAAVCTSVGRWERSLAGAGAGTVRPPANAPSVVAALTHGMDRAITATDRLAKDLDKIGVPAVKNGRAIAAALRDQVKRLRDMYVTAKAGITQWPTGDPAAFLTAAQALGKQIQASATAGTRNAAPDSTALGKAFTRIKACKAII